MQIRPLRGDDAPIYWPVRLRMLREHPEAFGSSYEESVDRPIEKIAARLNNEDSSPDNFVLGAFDEEGRLVGTVGMAREQAIKTRHRAMIWGVWVAPEARGKGLSRALMQAAIDRARIMPDLEQLNLHVVTTNDAARKVYRSLGFEVYGIEPQALKVDGRYYDEEYMVLYLT